MHLAVFMECGLQYAHFGTTSLAHGDIDRPTLQALANSQKSTQRTTNEAETQLFIALQPEATLPWAGARFSHFDNHTGVFCAFL